MQERKAAMHNRAKLGTQNLQTVLVCNESLNKCSIKSTHAIQKNQKIIVRLTC